MKEAKRKRISLFSLLIVTVLCITIGYAVINSIILNVTGKAEAEVPNEIFITNIEYVSDVGADTNESVINNYIKTTMDSKIALSKTDASSEIIYKVTVYNNTKEAGTFLDVIYSKDNYDNENVIYEILDTGFKIDEEIASKETKDIYIKFKYKDGILPSNNILNSYIKFSIGKPNMLAETSNIGDNYFSAVARGNIEKISFELGTVPENATSTFDASAKKDQSIIGYVTDSDSNGKYEITFSSDDIIYANTNSSYLFYDLTNLTNISFENFKTSYATDMHYMFYKCNSLTNLDLSSFDTSNVTDMSNMFYNCNALTSIDLSAFNTSNVTDMSWMFYGVSLTNLDVSSFDTSKVIDMSKMFYGSMGLTELNLSNFNTSNVTDMSYMFDTCVSLTNLDLSSFDTSSVTNMDYMFYYCKSLTTLDLSKFDTSNVTSMGTMFRICGNLKTIYASELFDTQKVTNSYEMFTGCKALVGGNGTTYNSNYVDKTYARIDNDETPGYFTSKGRKKKVLKICPESTFWDIASKSEVTSVTFGNTIENAPSSAIDVSEKDDGSILAWLDGTKLYVSSNEYIYANPDSSKLFYDCTVLRNIDFSNFNTSKVTTMLSMFYNCKNLAKLDLSTFDTSNVTEMYGVFTGCENLTSVDLSSFDTSNVTRTSMMFHTCYQLSSIDISNFNTSNITNMSYMFAYCTNLKTIYISELFDTSKVKESSNMFYECTNIIGGTGSTYSKNRVEIGMASESGYCTKAKENKVLKPTSENYNFWGLASPENVKSVVFEDTTGNAPDTAIDVSESEDGSILAWLENNDMSVHIASDGNIYANPESPYMFAYLGSNTDGLEKIKHINLLNTSNVTNMSAMFKDCNVSSLYLRDFNTSSATNMSSMFEQCELNELDLRKFNTANVTDMSNMFKDCKKLKTIYVTGKFETEKADNSTDMFLNCTSLVGEKGTVYNKNNTSKEYAKMDITGNPGYFTYVDSKNFLKICPESTFWGIANKTAITSSITFENTTKNAPSSATDISEKGDGSILAWVENASLYIASDKEIYAQPISSLLFFNCKAQNIEFSNFSTEETISMLKVFYFCSSLKELDVSTFDTSSVVNMSNMFNYSYSLESLDLNSFDTSNVTDMSGMFRDVNAITNLNISNFDTSNVTDMSNMFEDFDKMVNIDLSSFDTSKVTNMAGMFYQCKAVTTLDLSNFNTSKVMNMSAMFRECDALKTIFVSDMFDTSKVTTSTYMFYSSSYLRGENGTAYNDNYIDKEYARIDTSSTPGYFTKVYSGELKNLTQFSTYFWNTDITKDSIEKISFEKNVEPNNAIKSFVVSPNIDKNKVIGYVTDSDSNGKYEITVSSNEEINAPRNSSSIFSGLTELTQIKFDNFNTENVTNMYYLFRECKSLTNLDLSTFNTKNVTNMSNMLYHCDALEDLDLSSFNTTNVTTMSWMFGNCKKLLDLDLTVFDTSNVTDMSYMFYESNNLVNLYLSSFDTTNVTNMGMMFYNCNSLTSLDLSSFNTANVTNMQSMFANCANLKTIYASSNFDTTNVTSSSSNRMFDSATSLVGGNGTTYNSNYTNKTYARIDTSSTPGYFTKAKEKKVLKVCPKDKFWGIEQKRAFASVKFLDTLQDAPSTATDISEAEDGSILGWLEGTGSNKKLYIASNDYIYANPDSSYLFKSLGQGGTYVIETASIENLELLNTSMVTNMSNMFSTTNLTSIDLSHFDTSNVATMESMFHMNAKLTNLDISNFDTTNVTNMSNMLERCKALEDLDLSSFDTSNVTDMQYMFYKCNSLTSLDLSSFNTANVTDMQYMFADCTNLKTIYASSNFDTTNVTSSSSNRMFDSTTSLVGGNGTTYNSSYIDKTYARIDKDGQPGYFTLKAK